MSESSEQSQHATLRRLLGPSEPELGCEDCFEQLDRYVEIELGGRPADETIPGMRAHFDGCPACREDYLSLRALIADDAAR